MLQNELYDRTLTYWRLSRMWNNHVPEPQRVSTHTAMAVLRDSVNTMNPYRRLHHVKLKLLNEIIIGVGSPSEQPAKVISIR